MKFSEQLYRLTAKDVLGAPVAVRRFALNGASDTATSVQAVVITWTDPASIFVVSGVYGRLTPGAAQNALGASFRARDAQGNTLLEVAGFHNPRIAAAQQWQFSDSTFDFPLFTDEQITLLGVFDAGAAANSVSGQIWGWVIPRGNIQR